jgi:hypothetical protein
MEFQQNITITPQFLKAFREFQMGKMDAFFPLMKREGITGLQKFMSFDQVRFKFEISCLDRLLTSIGQNLIHTMLHSSRS